MEELKVAGQRRVLERGREGWRRGSWTIDVAKSNSCHYLDKCDPVTNQLVINLNKEDSREKRLGVMMRILRRRKRVKAGRRKVKRRERGT